LVPKQEMKAKLTAKQKGLCYLILFVAVLYLATFALWDFGLVFDSANSLFLTWKFVFRFLCVIAAFVILGIIFILRYGPGSMPDPPGAMRGDSKLNTDSLRKGDGEG
jgi:hypothetical protein